jgi:hypothetical protein
MTNMATDAAAGLLEWAGTAYHPVLLSHASPSGVSITGVALFAASSGLHATPPPALASELSRRVEQLGDAVATVLKD